MIHFVLESVACVWGQDVLRPKTNGGRGEGVWVSDSEAAPHPDSDSVQVSPY